jgi:hypothetical protein
VDNTDRVNPHIVSQSRILHHKAHIGLGMKLGLRGEKLVTSRLSDGVADRAAERLLSDTAHCHDVGCYVFSATALPLPSFDALPELLPTGAFRTRCLLMPPLLRRHSRQRS